MPEVNNQNQLTPELALKVVASAVEQLSLKKSEHIYLDNCLRVLAETIQPKEVVEKVEKAPKVKAPKVLEAVE